MFYGRWGFPCGSADKESTCNAGDLGSISVLGRSSGEGKGHPLWYSGLENSMDCIVHGVSKSPTRLSDFHFHFSLCGGCSSWLFYSLPFSVLAVGYTDVLLDLLSSPINGWLKWKNSLRYLLYKGSVPYLFHDYSHFSVNMLFLFWEIQLSTRCTKAASDLGCLSQHFRKQGTQSRGKTVKICFSRDFRYWIRDWAEA